jgi:hypothetical protein
MLGTNMSHNLKAWLARISSSPSLRWSLRSQVGDSAMWGNSTAYQRRHAIFNPIGRFVCPDGTDFPSPNMIALWGLAKFLRYHEAQSFSTHSQVTSVQFDGHDLLDHNVQVYAIPSITPISRFSSCATSISRKYKWQIPPSTTPQDFQDQPPRRQSICSGVNNIPIAIFHQNGITCRQTRACLQSRLSRKATKKSVKGMREQHCQLK